MHMIVVVAFENIILSAEQSLQDTLKNNDVIFSPNYQPIRISLLSGKEHNVLFLSLCT